MKKITALLAAPVLALSLLAAPVAAEEAALTRGEFAALVNGAYNIVTTAGELFTDVELEHPHAYDMMAAKRAGYLTGYPDGSGAPDSTVTRAEAAVMLGRVIDLPAPEAAMKYADESEIPDWARDSVDRACVNGLLTTTEQGAFEPERPLNAAEAEAMLEAALAVVGRLWSETVVNTTAHDGVAITGRLCLPAGRESVDKVVVLVNGTGISTYEMQGLQPPFRYKYYDYFADVFAQDGTAFFSYNTRGVTLAEEFPFYTVDEALYNTYTPQNCARDVAAFIREIRQNPATAQAKIILLGWSEGAIVAPLAALEPDSGVDALLLAGYPEENMEDILVWQLDGPQTLFYYTLVFDAQGQDHITREQYEADPYGVIGVSPLVYDLSFDELDANKNGVVDLEDFADLPRAQLHTQLREAIDRDDNAWIKENFMHLPAGWFKAHFELGRTSDILLRVDGAIPIHIFHGSQDLNCSVQQVYAAQERLAEQGRDDVQFHIFEGMPHNLGFDYWLVLGETTEAYEAIFETVRGM